MPPLVSILMPAFNAERWIAESIRSAVAQTWPHKEIIIVDDGSTDRTAEVAKQFASSQVRVFRKDNEGPAAARNHALEHSQGDYVQWLDADDVIAPDKIERQLEDETGSTRVLLSGAWGTFYYRTHRARFIASPLWQDLSPLEWLVRNVGLNVFMPLHTWLTSRYLVDAAGLWDTGLRMEEDAEYFCRVLIRSQGTRFIGRSRSYYRMVPSWNRNSTMGQSNQRKASKLRSMRMHIAYLRELEDSPRVQEACLSYLRNWVRELHPEHSDAVAELRKLAAELDGTIDPPNLGFKYSWLVPFIGYQRAKLARAMLPEIKHFALRRVDQAMHRLEGAASNL